MARKTLVIGMGSTGMAICEDVLRRIEGEWGSASHIPWVRALVFETASVVDTYVGNRNIAYQIGLSAEEGQKLAGAPSTFDASMEFSKWWDPSIVQKLSKGSDGGAGNVRMLGRASFLHPASFSKFKNAVIQALDELVALHEAEATEVRGELPDGTNPPVTFESAISVYVCGTLTGGTCSGSFIDVGFFLRTRPGYHLEVTGLLGIPNVALDERVLQANAAAALMELNHFHSDGAKYHALFPGDAAPVDRIAERPFDSVFICAPPTGDADSTALINRSFGQYIYLTGVYTLGQIAAELINPGRLYSQLKDVNGPMSFATIGVGLVEYPATHVIQACAYKLASIALKKWLEGLGVEPGPASLLVKHDPSDGKSGLNLSQDAVKGEILMAPQGQDPFLERIAREVANAETAAQSGNIGAMDECEANLEAGFRFDATDRTIPAGLFKQTIKENGERIIPLRLQALRDFFADRILSADDGPVWCASFAKALADYCAQWRDSCRGDDTSQQKLGEQRTAMNRARDRVDEAGKTWTLKLGWKGLAMQHCAKEYGEAAKQYWEQRLNELSAGVEISLCEQVIQFCNEVQERIDHPMYGMLAWSQTLQQRLHSEYRRLDDNPPPINGLLLYLAGKQVDADYKVCIDKVAKQGGDEYPPNIAGEELARRKVTRQWKWIADQLTAARFESTFDEPQVAASQNKPVPVLAKHQDVLELLCRGYFDELLNVSALDRLMRDPNWTTEIDRVNGKATAFLKIDDNGNPVHNPDPKRSRNLLRFAFFNGAEPVSAGTLAQELRGRLEPRIKTFASLDVPNRIIIVEARATFSIASIEGLQQPPGIATLRNAMDTMSRQYNLHSRMDVRWRSLNASADFPDQALVEAKILTGLALGIIERAGPDSFSFSYPATGPNRPGGTIALSSDIGEASYDLKDNTGALTMLSKGLDKFVADQGNPNVANLIQEFLDTKLPVYRLNVSGTSLTTETAAQKMRTYIVTVPGLDKALLKFYPHALTPEDYLWKKTDDSHPIPGYYCSGLGCGIWLAAEEKPQDLPHRCSRCGTFLYGD